MGEIRFVGTGETRGYPYLVYKTCVYIPADNAYNNRRLKSDFKSYARVFSVA